MAKALARLRDVLPPPLQAQVAPRCRFCQCRAVGRRAGQPVCVYHQEHGEDGTKCLACQFPPDWACGAQTEATGDDTTVRSGRLRFRP